MAKKNYASLYQAPVPQTQPLDERQVQNHAGGFVYQLDIWKRLDRFLVLGSDASTYYQKASDLTRENAASVIACYDSDPARTVARIVEISMAGRAPKNDPAIFALALGVVHPTLQARSAAFAAVQDVCRTGTHLFTFVNYARALGKGWGRGMKRAVARWYDSRPAGSVAYQAIKYRNREDYTHKRLLQTAHPMGIAEGEGQAGPDRTALYRWICGREYEEHHLPPIVRGHLAAMAETDMAKLAELVAFHRLPWEAIPTQALTRPEVWRAMLPSTGITALIRQLGNLTRIGVIAPLNDAEAAITATITDVEDIQKARLHPFTVLQALKIYGQGHGMRSTENSWSPSAKIIGALNAAFYAAFSAIEPTGKRHLFGIDVSGSMSSPFGDSAVTAAEVAAVLAMVGLRTEPRSYAFGFAGGFVDLKLAPTDDLGTVLRKTSMSNFGSTDCAVPMLHAMSNNIDVDVFVVITDNETWHGREHPAAALKRYRAKTGINAKLVVIGVTSTKCSIADPNDPGMLDVVGFDSAVPAVIADFVRG